MDFSGYNSVYLMNGNEGNFSKSAVGIDNIGHADAVIIVCTDKTSPRRIAEISEIMRKHPGAVDTDNIRAVKGAIKRRIAWWKAKFRNEYPEMQVIAAHDASDFPQPPAESGTVSLQAVTDSGWGSYHRKTIQDGGRIKILIDFENVSSDGLTGSNYLTADDEVILFYSNNRPYIEQQYLNDIKDRAGSFEAVKLKNTGKNGLDFYMAVKVGQILQENPEVKIMLVSKDNGFTAVKEYCDGYTTLRNPIVIAEDIESGLSMIDGDTVRCREIAECRKRVSIDLEYAKYQESMRIRLLLYQSLSEAGFEAEVDNVIELIGRGKTPRERYLSALHSFGREKGNRIYRIIKDEVFEKAE